MRTSADAEEGMIARMQVFDFGWRQAEVRESWFSRVGIVGFAVKRGQTFVRIVCGWISGWMALTFQGWSFFDSGGLALLGTARGFLSVRLR